MKRFWLVIIIVLVLIGLSFLAYYIYLRAKQNGRELILYGNVDVRQVDIGFRVAGQVEALYFEEGDYVRTGAALARLVRSPYTSQVSQAEANLISAKASFENAEKLLKRRQELIGFGGVSQEDFDNAQSNYNTSQANVASFMAALDVAKNNLSYTEAFAPTDGVILTRIREPGTVVNPADPVCILSVNSPVWIRAFVSTKDLGRVFFGMPAEVTIDTPDAPIYHGRVGFISPVAEFTPKTVETTSLRTDLVYRLRIYIDNPDQILKQGMPVTVKLRVMSHE